MFPTAVRARGQSIGSAMHWIMNTRVAWSFRVVAAHSRAAPFALFAGMMLFQLLTVLAVYPETRGITLEEMENGEEARHPAGLIADFAGPPDTLHIRKAPSSSTTNLPREEVHWNPVA